MINTFSPVFHWKAKSQKSTKKPFLLIAHYDVVPVLSMLKVIAPHKKGIEAFVMKKPELFSSLTISSMSKGKQTVPMLKTTVAFTITNSGSAANVLPKQASCVANIRILPNDTTEEIIAWLRSFGFDFEIKPLALEDASRCSKTDTESFYNFKSGEKIGK